MTGIEDLPILRTSERKAFKRCPQMWWWAWRDGLVPVKQKGGALWFGTGIHLALEHWYIPGKKRGIDPRETWEKFVKDQVEHVKVEMLSGDAPDGSDVAWVEAGDLGKQIFDNYLKEYGQDERWEVISPEQSFQVLVPKPKTKIPIVNYAGTFDLVARDHQDNGKLYLWDHKTAKSIQTGHLPLDDQAGSYWAVATHVLRKQGLIGAKESLKGITYNFIMKSPPDDRPENEFGLKCNKPVKSDYLEALAAFDKHLGHDEALISENFASNGKLTVTKLEEMAKSVGIRVLGKVSDKQPAKRFLRETVTRTSGERRSQIERIGAEATVMDMFRYGDLPIIKNPTKDCQWECDFRTLCELDEQGGDTEEYISVVYKQEDPYAAHRLQNHEVEE